jgi:hypothetical protein
LGEADEAVEGIVASDVALCVGSPAKLQAAMGKRSIDGNEKRNSLYRGK